MKSMARHLALFVFAATFGFLFVVWQLPNFIMSRLMDRVAESAQSGRLAPPLPDEKARGIVLPSPDLAYVLCVYDLAKASVTIDFNPPDLPYWSIAAYAANTDNFLVINDRNAGSTRRLMLLAPGQPSAAAQADTRIVQPPGERGLVLFRGLMPTADGALVKQVQASVSCQQNPKP